MTPLLYAALSVGGCAVAWIALLITWSIARRARQVTRLVDAIDRVALSLGEVEIGLQDLRIDRRDRALPPIPSPVACTEGAHP